MTSLSEHYGSSELFDRIVGALAEAGLTLGSLDVDALAGVDEFHLGGRLATDALLADVRPQPGWNAVDVGCGIGGAARVLAGRGCAVLGVDLTPEFVDVARRLTAALGLAGRAQFAIGSALALPVDDGAVDLVTLLHVGMNIADKVELTRELRRVLRPGGTLAVYDIMRTGDGDVTFPVPWATHPAQSFVAPPEAYVEAVDAAGFDDVVVEPRGELVAHAIAAQQASPPPVNLGHLMGARFGEMFTNLGRLVRSGVLAPIQITARAC